MRSRFKRRRHPLQYVERDEHGVVRFRENKIVRYLLDWASLRGMNLNLLATKPFPQGDWEHFYQQIGYSVSGYGDLSMVSRESVLEADERVERLIAREETKKEKQNG